MKIRLAIASLIALPLWCGAVERNKADEALEQAQEFAEQGKFEQALERHVWYHNHALEIAPSQYGVRLSFALMYWVELGKKYPKALQTLREIRGTKTARLAAGETNRLLFDDVVANNRALGESQATVETFKKIVAVQPGFAGSVADLADAALFNAGEYDLEKKYLTDPMAKFEAIKRTLDSGREIAKSSRIPQRSQQAFENNFTNDVVRLIVMLEKTGDGKIAREIQTKALAAYDNVAIQNAVKH